MTKRHTTRESWLKAATIKLRSHIKAETGLVVPPVSVSIGWPGGRGDKSGVIGQCWNAKVAADGKAAIFISPKLSDPVRILDVLAHEMVHALHPDAGHRGEFPKTAAAIGLVAPWTATNASDDFAKTLKGIARKLGPLGHGEIKTGVTLTRTDPKTGKTVTLTPTGSPKQGTRMLKIACPADGTILRGSAKALAIGLPTCACGTEMVIA